MLKVECYSGYRLNERPVAFSLMGRRYRVEEIVDRWYGEGANYFKVRADDKNIYLLKYDEWKDRWDLVLYQNPRKLESLPPGITGSHPLNKFSQDPADSGRYTPLN